VGFTKSAMKAFLAKSLAVLVLGCALNSQAWDIYSNTNGSVLWNYPYSAGSLMIGDEIQPVGGGYLNHIDIQYYGLNFGGGEQARVALFENNGAPISLFDRTAQTPGSTPLYDSGWFNISATPHSTINIDAGPDFTPGSIFISGSYNLTLAIQFSGIGAGEDAGVSLYDWETVGDNYNTYWTFNGTAWNIVSDNSAPTPTGGTPGVGYVDFGMRIDVIPEPSAFSLVLMGGLAVLGSRRFLRRK
jgi:hypothetical protein